MQQGFTLIELMVAIVIGFLVTLALIAVFLNLSQSNREMAKTNSQMENGRSVLQLLEADIIHAGYWGGFVPQFDNLISTVAPGDLPTAVPDPCAAYATWNAAYWNGLVGIPVQSYEGLPTGCGTTLLPNKKADTDSIVVRHAETCIPGVGACEADTAGKLYFQASFCETEISAGAPYVLGTTGFTLRKRNCAGGDLAAKRKFISNIYYIRDYARVVGDGIPTLVRSQFDVGATGLAHQPPTPLIEGIEGFRVELGVDDVSDAGSPVDYSAAVVWKDATNLTSPTNRGDGSPDGTYVRCTTAVPCTAAQLVNAVALKIFVLARAEVPSVGHKDTKTYNLGGTTLGPFNDGFKRHVYSTTVRLNNISGRRETPK